MFGRKRETIDAEDMQSMVEGKKIPENWKKNPILTIHKNGDHHKYDNNLQSSIPAIIEL